MTNRESYKIALSVLTDAAEQDDTIAMLRFISDRAIADPNLFGQMELTHNLLAAILAHIALTMHMEILKANAPTPS